LVGSPAQCSGFEGTLWAGGGISRGLIRGINRSTAQGKRFGKGGGGNLRIDK
jgi:hypothetical protein